MVRAAVAAASCAALAWLPATSAQASDTTQATAYQQDASHDGNSGDTFTPPLAKGWSHSFTGLVSYPIIAQGLVFVTTANSPPGDENPVYGTELYAFDEATGGVAWGPIALSGTYGDNSLAYDSGTLYSLNFDGDLSAYDAATGAVKWTTAVGGNGSGGVAFTSGLTVGNGYVYVAGGSLGEIYAINEVTGTQRWNTTAGPGGDGGDPVVMSNALYVIDACDDAFDINPLSGNVVWQHETGCYGGSGSTGVYANGLLYDRGNASSDSPTILNPSTGDQVGTFTAGPAPAFGDGMGFFVSDGTLSAKPDSGGAGWTFSGDGTIDSAPIVVNGFVYVGGKSGMLYALDAQSGKQVWSDDVGSPIIAPQEGSVNELTGMAAAGGMLLVSASETLVAYAPSTPVNGATPRARVRIRVIAAPASVALGKVARVSLALSAPSTRSTPTGTLTATMQTTVVVHHQAHLVVRTLDRVRVRGRTVIVSLSTRRLGIGRHSVRLTFKGSGIFANAVTSRSIAVHR